jgi:hypothetical protein
VRNPRLARITRLRLSSPPASSVADIWFPTKAAPLPAEIKADQYDPLARTTDRAQHPVCKPVGALATGRGIVQGFVSPSLPAFLRGQTNPTVSWVYRRAPGANREAKVVLLLGHPRSRARLCPPLLADSAAKFGWGRAPRPGGPQPPYRLQAARHIPQNLPRCFPYIGTSPSPLAPGKGRTARSSDAASTRAGGHFLITRRERRGEYRRGKPAKFVPSSKALKRPHAVVSSALPGCGAEEGRKNRFLHHSNAPARGPDCLNPRSVPIRR